MTEPFSTQRIRLRALEAADVRAVHEYMNDARLFGCRYIPWNLRDAAPLSLEQVEGILETWRTQKRAFTLGVEAREDGRLVGHAGLHWGWDAHCPSLSVVIAPPDQRQGLGTEATHLLLAHAFEETPAHNVSAWAGSWNGPALAFASACGFVESGRIPRAGLRRGVYVDEVLLDILRPEWCAWREDHDGA